MSWSVYLHKKKWMDDEIEVGNHTYNVSPMYSKAMGITISDLDGKIRQMAGEAMKLRYCFWEILLLPVKNIRIIK